MDGRQALRARMTRTARSSREQDRSERTPQRSAEAGCGAKPFLGYFFGAFAKKVTRRKGERGPHNHHRKTDKPTAMVNEPEIAGAAARPNRDTRPLLQRSR